MSDRNNRRRLKYSHVVKVNQWNDGELEIVEKGFGSYEDAKKFVGELEHEAKIYDDNTKELVHHEQPKSVTETYA